MKRLLEVWSGRAVRKLVLAVIAKALASAGGAARLVKLESASANVSIKLGSGLSSWGCGGCACLSALRLRPQYLFGGWSGRCICAGLTALRLRPKCWVGGWSGWCLPPKGSAHKVGWECAHGLSSRGRWRMMAPPIWLGGSVRAAHQVGVGGA